MPKHAQFSAYLNYTGLILSPTFFKLSLPTSHTKNWRLKKNSFRNYIYLSSQFCNSQFIFALLFRQATWLRITIHVLVLGTEKIRKLLTRASPRFVCLQYTRCLSSQFTLFIGASHNGNIASPLCFFLILWTKTADICSIVARFKIPVLKPATKYRIRKNQLDATGIDVYSH